MASDGLPHADCQATPCARRQECVVGKCISASGHLTLRNRCSTHSEASPKTEFGTTQSLCTKRRTGNAPERGKQQGIAVCKRSPSAAAADDGDVCAIAAREGGLHATPCLPISGDCKPRGAETGHRRILGFSAPTSSVVSPIATSTPRLGVNAAPAPLGCLKAPEQAAPPKNASACKASGWES